MPCGLGSTVPGCSVWCAAYYNGTGQEVMIMVTLVPQKRSTLCLACPIPEGKEVCHVLKN